MIHSLLNFLAPDIALCKLFFRTGEPPSFLCIVSLLFIELAALGELGLLSVPNNLRLSIGETKSFDRGIGELGDTLPSLDVLLFACVDRGDCIGDEF